jgi:1-acyl-sn-glycerol-3-phosphate acyltransferase
VHRGWIDPFLVLHALPTEPRAWFLGSAATAFDSRWKEWLLRRLGGMLPVWRGGHGVEQHVASADAVVRVGGVFVLFPEGGVAGPAADITAFRVGAAIIALRTGAPVLPIVMVGNHELYLGRRLVTQILPATSARELLKLPPDAALPRPNSREEIALAKALTELLEDLLAPEVRRRYPETVDPPGRPRRLRRLTWLLLKRPNRRGS